VQLLNRHLPPKYRSKTCCHSALLEWAAANPTIPNSI